jgi:hypothetical protein
MDYIYVSIPSAITPPNHSLTRTQYAKHLELQTTAPTLGQCRSPLQSYDLCIHYPAGIMYKREK